ncbi:glycosyltransferase family 2 protein [Psychroserpens sp. XS_ASV72]|uniref:glycosyltransferase family 2 protein n=1 Tax=Psychroserpens sp. XS_ASV72 TaxID=3241293 RepID=UPI0035138457
MFNIITPTYNRRHTLHLVYESLLNQDFKDFNWIIVDDGSTDHTDELVESWVSENKLTIHYKKLTKNQGKSNAVNHGLDFCHEPYTIIADSDDSFDTNTLSDLKREWNILENKQLDRPVASIWTLTKTPEGEIIGQKFPSDYWIVGFEERVLNHDIEGEKWASWDTSILKSHKMFSSTIAHIEESQTWNSINKKNDFLCLNVAHRSYYYSPDGIMATKKTRKQIAKNDYYSAYYALKDVSVSEMFKHNYFRTQAFNYFKSWLFYSDKKLKLSFPKLLVSFILSIFHLFKRLIKKLT